MSLISSERWAQIKQQAPTTFAIVCGVNFMNAKDAETAGIFGTLTCRSTRPAFKDPTDSFPGKTPNDWN